MHAHPAPPNATQQSGSLDPRSQHRRIDCSQFISANMAIISACVGYNFLQSLSVKERRRLNSTFARCFIGDT
jgi:hypothetical protein